MKIYAVVGSLADWEGGDWYYAYCTTKKLAQREMAKAIAEKWDDDYEWGIEEYDVVTE